MFDFGKFDSLVQVMEYFSTEECCKRVLEQSRWGGDVVCPYCGCHHCKVGYRGRYVCPGCLNKFSCTVGTIFENTKVSLRKWFIAIYLISYHKKGISSCQLARDIKVTQKTAWYMLQKIRCLYWQGDHPLSGDIECDEVYIGGKEAFKHRSKRSAKNYGRSLKKKTPVFGIMRRDTRTIYATVVTSTDRATLLPIITRMVDPSSHIYTDELSAYTPLTDLGYDHHIIKHGKEQYVKGHCYTNTIEGFWSHFKRMILGTYHRLSKEHLQRYVDESVFRWNHRNATSGRIFKILMGRSLKIVPYAAIRSTGI